MTRAQPRRPSRAWLPECICPTVKARAACLSYRAWDRARDKGAQPEPAEAGAACGQMSEGISLFYFLCASGGGSAKHDLPFRRHVRGKTLAGAQIADANGVAGASGG